MQKTSNLQKLCREAIEKQRVKISKILNTTELNYPNLKTDNCYLDEMILEYMFYFDEKSRRVLLNKQKFKELEKTRQEIL